MRNLLLLLAVLWLSACVSKKKHLEALLVKARAIDSLQQHIEVTSAVMTALEKDLIAETAAKETLIGVEQRLQNRLIELDDEIERLIAASSSQAEDMDTRLQKKEEEVDRLERIIAHVNEIISRQHTLLLSLSDALRDTLQAFAPEVYDMKLAAGKLSLSFQSDFLFYSGSTSKMHRSGMEALSYVSQLLVDYPQLEIVIVGHTDNRPLRRSSIPDKWTFSGMRAARLAAIMTFQYDVSTSRVTAAGKGEYAPVASNGTEEGQKQNNRMEIQIFPANTSLIRDIQREIQDNN
jgi:chemotaxis protein MotB